MRAVLLRQARADPEFLIAQALPAALLRHQAPARIKAAALAHTRAEDAHRIAGEEEALRAVTAAAEAEDVLSINTSMRRVS